MQTKLAMFEYLKLQAFIMHFCMIRLRQYNRTLVITRNTYIIMYILFIPEKYILHSNIFLVTTLMQ